MKNWFSLKTWIYRICGFRTLVFDGTFRKNTSYSRYYSIFVALLFVLAEIVNVVQSDFRYDPQHSATHQVISLAYIVTSASCAVLSILSESFININDKLQLHNKFIQIHDMLSTRPFEASDPLVHVRTNFIIFLIINTIQMVSTATISTSIWYEVYYDIRTLVIVLNILETFTEINTSRNYVKILNEAILLRYSQNIKGQNTIDFGKTTLHPGVKINHDGDQLLTENQKTLIDYTKIYDLLSDSIKLISLRFTYTFLPILLTSSIAVVLIANKYVSESRSSNQIFSLAVWFIEHVWFITSVALSVEYVNMEVQRTKQITCKLSIMESKDRKQEKGIEKFMGLLLRRKLVFVIGGAIQVDFTILYSVAAVTASYMIIFIQMAQ